MTEPVRVLEYRPPPPEPPGPLAAWPVVTVCVSIWVPGLTRLLLRGRGKWVGGAALLAAVPLAFLFFGPFWGEVLFRRTPYQQAGLWPFVATTAAVVAANVYLTVLDYRYVRAAAGGR